MNRPKLLSNRKRLILWLMLLVGIWVFIAGVLGSEPLRVWQIFLVNFLFWSGLAQGAVVFAAVYDVVQAKWGASVRRLAQGLGAFLPISLLLFFVLFLGAEVIFPWIRHPVPEKTAWLNLTFFFSRDTFGILILYVTAFAYLYYTLRPEMGADCEQNKESSSYFQRLFTISWQGLQAEQERSRRFLSLLTPFYLLTYTYIFSLLGFDLVMSLEPHFYSSLFGAYFFMSSFYGGIAATAVAAVLLRRPLGWQSAVGRPQFQDLGMMLIGFCMVTGDFLWSQYAVIWYGNLPEETGYVIKRTATAPWDNLALTILFTAFLIPFVLLLFRKIKETPWALASVATLIMTGLLLERYLLVIPALWPEATLPLGWRELLITLSFFAAFVLSTLAFVSRLPSPEKRLEYGLISNEIDTLEN